MKTSFVSAFRRTSCLAALALCLPVFAQQAPVPFPGSDTPEDADNRLPKLISRVDPAYPAAAAQRKVQGEVFVAFVVDKTGTPKRVRAFFSHHEELEKAAEDAVRQWKFTAGIHQGRAVNTQMIVQIEVAPPKPGA